MSTQNHAHLRSLLKAVRLHALLHFDVEGVAVDWTKDLVDFANLLLVLQKDAAVEVRDLLVCALHDEVALASVGHDSDFFDPIRRGEGA